MKRTKRFTALMLTGLMGAVSVAGCSKTDSPQQTSAVVPETNAAADVSEIADKEALLLGGEGLSGVFNPLFAESEADQMVCSLLFDTICSVGEYGELEDAAGHLEATDGEGESVETTSSDGSSEGVELLTYQLTLKEGQKFSDGSAMTIDDVIFTWKLMADPYYEGSYSLAEVPVRGMQEYYYDTEDVAAYQKNLSSNYSNKQISEEDFIAYLIDTKLNGWFDGELPGDLDGKGTTWVDYLKSNGYDTKGIENDTDALLKLLAECEYKYYSFSYDPYTYYQEKAHADLLEGGVEVPEIKGIEKVDDYTCKIQFTSADTTALRAMTVIPIFSKTSYGTEYQKGDITKLQKEQDVLPVGSGAYVLHHYEGGEASLAASETSRVTCAIPYVKVKDTAEGEKEQALKDGSITAAVMKTSSSLGKTENLQTIRTEGSGFYYFGINTDLVNTPSVREGLMYLIDKSLFQASQEEIEAILAQAGAQNLTQNNEETSNSETESQNESQEETQNESQDESQGETQKEGQNETLISELITWIPQTWPMTKLSVDYPAVKSLREAQNPTEDSTTNTDAENEESNSDSENNGDSTGNEVNETLSGKVDIVEEDFYQYNVDTARSKFGSAGFWSNNGELVKNGEQLKLNMGISEELPKVMKAIAYQLKNDLEDLGASVSLKEYTESEMEATIPTAAFDMWIGSITDLADSYDLEDYYVYGAEKNYFHQQNGLVKMAFDELKDADSDADRAYNTKEILDYVKEGNYCRALCEDVSEVYVINTDVLEWEGHSALDEYDSLTEIIGGMKLK